MARTITVAPGPNLQPGEVAIWEVDERHPDGEVFLAKAHKGEDDPTIEVARTNAINTRLGDGRLIECEARPKPAPRDSTETAPNQGGGAQAITDAQGKALAAAGFDTPEKIRAASDDDLLKVDGIGPAALVRLREATKE
jgi:hypothetical protein